MSEAFLVLAAVAAGCGFALMGVAYQTGESRGVSPPRFAVWIGVTGVLLFAGRAVVLPWTNGAGRASQFVDAPAVVWILGLVAGVAQGACIHLVAPAMRRGPFAPVWCALNFMFVPAAVWAALVHAQDMATHRWIALVLAGGCIVSSAFAKQAAGAEPDESDPQPEREADPASRLAYFGFVLTVFLLIGITGVSIEELKSRPLADTNLWKGFSDIFFIGLYGGFAVAVLGGPKPALQREASRRFVVGLGLLAGGGSVVGMQLMALSSSLPCGAALAIVSVVTIGVGGVTATLFFGEKRSVAWYATLVLATASVLLFNITPGETSPDEDGNASAAPAEATSPAPVGDASDDG